MHEIQISQIRVFSLHCRTFRSVTASFLALFNWEMRLFCSLTIAVSCCTREADFFSFSWNWVNAALWPTSSSVIWSQTSLTCRQTKDTETEGVSSHSFFWVQVNQSDVNVTKLLYMLRIAILTCLSRLSEQAQNTGLHFEHLQTQRVHTIDSDAIAFSTAFCPVVITHTCPAWWWLFNLSFHQKKKGKKEKKRNKSV